MKWWEKTVEYFFVVNYLPAESGFIGLDGAEEVVGDAIFSTDNRWILIEFKKDESCLNTEIKKFPGNYDEAKSVLGRYDKFHVLVYGENRGLFNLKCKRYFSRVSRPIGEVLSSATSLKAFEIYVKKLLEFKYPEDPDKSGPQLEWEDYSMVAVMTKSGDLVACMSLADFIAGEATAPDPARVACA